MFLNMYTKLILFLFMGTIFPTQSFDPSETHYGYDQIQDKNSFEPYGYGVEPLGTNRQTQQYGIPASGQTDQYGRLGSLTRSGGTQSGPPGGGLHASSEKSSLAVIKPTYFGVHNPVSTPGTPIRNRFGGQLAGTIQSSVPAGQPSKFQHPNAGSNNQRNKDQDQAIDPINLNESPQGSNLQTSSQNDRSNVDPSRITYDETSAVQPQSESKNRLELSAMKSGIEIMKRIGREKPGNSVISPLSILIALSTLHQGARGNSEQELADFLSDATTSKQWIYNFTNSFKGRSRGNILKIANAIFVDNTFHLNRGFKNVAAQDFQANVESVNFRSPFQAASTINEWVSTSTGSLIPSLVDAGSLDTSTQLLLTNAVFFKGIWNATFPKERTVPRVFALRPNEDKQGVIYMHQIGQFRAGEDNALDAKWVFLPFLNREFEMLFIMPNADFGLEKLINSLTPRALYNMLQDNTFREVVLGIPKFKLSFETDLVSTLTQLGIQSIFNSAADLSGLGTSGNHESLYVSKVLHKATIEINEEGGVAAAVTGLAVNTLSLASYNEEFRFIANHPFLVLLFDKTSPVPLFMARIVDP